MQGLLDRYFELLPGYQSCSLADLKIKRVLFGGFPCYSQSPLQPQFDRIVQVSLLQGPLRDSGCFHGRASLSLPLLLKVEGWLLKQSNVGTAREGTLIGIPLEARCMSTLAPLAWCPPRIPAACACT